MNAEIFIDLHLHLDGSLSVSSVKELAKMQNIDLPSDTELKKKLTVSQNCRDLNEYLEKFEFPLSLLQTREGLKTELTGIAEKVFAVIRKRFFSVPYVPVMAVAAVGVLRVVKAAAAGRRSGPVEGLRILHLQDLGDDVFIHLNIVGLLPQGGDPLALVHEHHPATLQADAAIAQENEKKAMEENDNGKE